MLRSSLKSEIGRCCFVLHAVSTALKSEVLGQQACCCVLIFAIGFGGIRVWDVMSSTYESILVADLLEVQVFPRLTTPTILSPLERSAF